VHEKLYRVWEVATLYSIKSDLVRRLFIDEPGVIVIQKHRRRGPRIYRTLLIPESVMHRVFARMTVGAA